jgi:hypothetical protein
MLLNFSTEVCGIRIPLFGLSVPRFGTLFIHSSELIEKGLVADLQNLGRLTPIPTRLEQNAFNVLPLRLHRGTAADLK